MPSMKLLKRFEMPSIILNRMVHVTIEDMENKQKRGFHNPLISAIQRAFPEAKYIWVDEYIHLNFNDSNELNGCQRLNMPKHLEIWFLTYKQHPAKCHPISFGLSIEVDANVSLARSHQP